MPNPDPRPTDNKQLSVRIFSFLREIGIEAHEKEIAVKTFLPGIQIENGRMAVDLNKLAYPGDLLHEAGHIAVTPSADRSSLSGNFQPENDEDQGSEIAAILWSYAALCHLNLPPEAVFHENGYKGASAWFIENFSSGNYIGLPLLQWMGLCKKENNPNPETEPFPKMIKWLRE